MLLSQTSTQSPEKEKITLIWICRYLKRKASHGRVLFSQWVNELIQVTCTEIQNGRHSIGHPPLVRICQAEGNTYVKGREKLTRSTVAPSRFLAKVRRLIMSAWAHCQEEEGYQVFWNLRTQKSWKIKKEEEGGRTMEQWKSKRRKQQGYPFHQREERTWTSIKNE